MSDNELTVEDLEFVKQVYQLGGILSQINNAVSSDSYDSDPWSELLNNIDNDGSQLLLTSDRLANADDDDDDEEGYYEHVPVEELTEQIAAASI